ncbi:hypothetical protein [Rothia sp. 32237D007AR]
MNLQAEFTSHQRLSRIRKLLEAGIITTSEAEQLCQSDTGEDAPLGELQMASFVDYLRGLSDVWIHGITPDQKD